MPRIALIDGDTVAYKCAASTCRTWYYVDGKEFKYKKDARQYCEDVLGIPSFIRVNKKRVDNHVGLITSNKIEEDFGLTKYNVDQMMLRILGDTGVDDYEVWFSGEGNYRYEIATTRPYKGTRDRSATPTNLEATLSYMVADYGGMVVDGIEADDMLGIRQTQEGDGSIIATTDKDLRMIPGWHYNISSGTIDRVSETQAWYNFYFQLLIGDSSDNIQGVIGCGEKTASKLLRSGSTPLEWYRICKDKYHAVYGVEAMDQLTESASLLWIQREEGVIWTPPDDG